MDVIAILTNNGLFIRLSAYSKRYGLTFGFVRYLVFHECQSEFYENLNLLVTIWKPEIGL